MVISCDVKMTRFDTRFDYVRGNVMARPLQRCGMAGFALKETSWLAQQPEY
jgi:hypothetical protein